MTRRVGIGALCLLALVAAAAARPTGQGPPFTDAFPAEEFAARRAKVLDAIGDGIAVIEGAAEYPGFLRFRQSSQFYYLTGVEVPRALLMLDGRTRQATLFLAPRNERLERSEGPVLVPGDDAATLTGVSTVRGRDDFKAALIAAATPGRIVYVPMRAESPMAGTPLSSAASARATLNDPWDGRPSRQKQFVSRLQAAAPTIVPRDLDTILDELRFIKSPREIAAIREATRLSGLGIMEGIRNARPGMKEYEVEAMADYVFKRGGAFGVAYFALVATGVNASYPHYHAGTATLKDGDFVIFDYAPDYHYYSSDVTRMFPANGHFSPRQRELYTVYLRLYEALMQSIVPNVAPRDIIKTAVVKMDAILAAYHFSGDETRAAARAFVEDYRQSTANGLGHTVGMEVHDVYPVTEVLKPGMVFTIEPALTIAADRTYIRLEDVIVITGTGYENLSAFAPVEPDAIEALMAEPGRFKTPFAAAAAGGR